MAEKSKEFDAKLRAWLVSYFDVDPKKINLEKAFRYMNYLNTPEQKTERFLDKLDDERRRFEEREARRLEQTVATRFAN